jgi:hypothetical protein
MAQFAVLMTENDDAWGRLPPADQDALMAKYTAWVEELSRTGRMRGGAPLGGPGRLLRRVGGSVVDEPYAATKDVLTGWFLIEATDLADATAVARGCPALTHGESVIVRPLGHV